MNMNTQTRWIMGLSIALALAVGILIGYASANAGERKIGMHRMPDGSMMMNNGTDMKGMMHSMNQGLYGKTGDAFDQAFLAEMIVHHEGAVEMAQQVLKVSQRPELIKLANDIIAAQTKEIGMMKEWQNTWFK
jgi:uncharacterized protein (DUF305 family)